jgi:hypothetical protein
MSNRIEQLLKLAHIFELQCLATGNFDDLKGTMESYLHKTITPEEWKNWLAVNGNLVGGKIDLFWSVADGADEMFAHFNDKWLIIDKTQNLRDVYEPLQQSLLKGTSGIPNLWISVTNITDQNDYIVDDSLITADIAHYAWVFETLEEMTDYTGSPVAMEHQMADFIRKNKATFDKLRSNFKHEPVFLGTGADGSAFDIGGERVLKIFGDTHAYQKAKEAMNRLHTQPELAKSEAMIYDIGKIGEINGNPIYYYIMEKLDPMPKDYEFRSLMSGLIAKISIAVLKDREFLRRVKRQINEPSKHARIKSVVKKKSEQIAEQIEYEAAKIVHSVWDQIKKNQQQNGNDELKKMQKGKGELKENWLTLFVEEIMMKYLTGRTDLHSGNIGITGEGELRYFDPSYSGHTSAINVGGDILGRESSY